MGKGVGEELGKGGGEGKLIRGSRKDKGKKRE